MKIRPILLIIFLANTSCLVSKETKDTEGRRSIDRVYQLYKDYAWEALGLGPANSKSIFGEYLEFENKDVLMRYFDSEMASLLFKDANGFERKHGQIGKLDFDPIFASQDPAATDLKLRDIGSNIILTTFIYPGNHTKVSLKYMMVLEKGKWKIGDIIYPNYGGTSLKKILK